MRPLTPLTLGLAVGLSLSLGAQGWNPFKKPEVGQESAKPENKDAKKEEGKEGKKSGLGDLFGLSNPMKKNEADDSKPVTLKADEIHSSLAKGFQAAITEKYELIFSANDIDEKIKSIENLKKSQINTLSSIILNYKKMWIESNDVEQSRKTTFEKMNESEIADYYIKKLKIVNANTNYFKKISDGDIDKDTIDPQDYYYSKSIESKKIKSTEAKKEFDNFFAKLKTIEPKLNTLKRDVAISKFSGSWASEKFLANTKNILIVDYTFQDFRGDLISDDNEQEKILKYNWIALKEKNLPMIGEPYKPIGRTKYMQTDDDIYATKMCYAVVSVKPAFEKTTGKFGVNLVMDESGQIGLDAGYSRPTLDQVQQMYIPTTLRLDWNESQNKQILSVLNGAGKGVINWYSLPKQYRKYLDHTFFPDPTKGSVMDMLSKKGPKEKLAELVAKVEAEQGVKIDAIAQFTLSASPLGIVNLSFDVSPYDPAVEVKKAFAVTASPAFHFEFPFSGRKDGELCHRIARGQETAAVFQEKGVITPKYDALTGMKIVSYPFQLSHDAMLDLAGRYLTESIRRIKEQVK